MAQNDTDECPGDGIYKFSMIETILWYVLYAGVALQSVLGNALVILVVWSKRRMQTVTNYLILNLAIADMLTGALGIPFRFQAALLQKWVLPAPLCRITPYVETVTMSVSVITLTISAVDRFASVMLRSAPQLQKKSAIYILVAVWIFCVLLALPFGMGHQVKSTNSSGSGNMSMTVLRCVAIYSDARAWKIYNLYLTVIQYFVPVFVVNGAYILIAYKVWITLPPSDNSVPGEVFEISKKRVVKMLIMVVCLFTFCWLPLETYFVLSEVRPCINAYRKINIIFFCCHWLAMSNSCVNPLIYGAYNERFRRGYGRVLARLCCLRKIRRRSFAVRRKQHPFQSAARCKLGKESACQTYIESELGTVMESVTVSRQTFGLEQNSVFASLFESTDGTAAVGL